MSQRMYEALMKTRQAIQDKKFADKMAEVRGKLSDSCRKVFDEMPQSEREIAVHIYWDIEMETEKRNADEWKYK